MGFFTALLAVVQVVGAVVGSHNKKKAAKKGYTLAKQNIRQRSGWFQKDLLLETQTLVGDITANVGATGMRMGSGSVTAVLESEQDKHDMRRERILAWESLAISEAKANRKAAIKSADLGAVMGASKAAFSYMGSRGAPTGSGAFNPAKSFTQLSGIDQSSPYSLRYGN